jgi:hypothetical protein
VELKSLQKKLFSYAGGNGIKAIFKTGAGNSYTNLGTISLV